MCLLGVLVNFFVLKMYSSSLGRVCCIQMCVGFQNIGKKRPHLNVTVEAKGLFSDLSWVT